MRPLERRKKEEGQATIEFALTMILLCGLILFFVQISLVFAWGNYVHYATFMSARAYLAAGPSPADQQERAKTVISRMVKKGSFNAGDRFPAIAKGFGEGEPKGFVMQEAKGERDSSWMNGVRYTFRSKLFMLPLVRNNGDQGVNFVTLTSESWLGREPTYEECVSEMSKLKGYWDNGC